MNNTNNGNTPNNQNGTSSSNFSDIKNDAKDGMKQTFNAAKDALNEGKKTIEEQVQELKDELTELKDQGKNWLNKENVKEKLNHYKEEIGGQCKKSTEKISDCISERPLKSVLVVAGFGFLLGLFANRK